MRARLASCLLLAACIGCRSPEPNPGCDPSQPSVPLPDFAAQPNIVHAEIEPRDIDPATDRYPGSIHQLFVPDDPSIARRGELLLFLPGTRNFAQAFRHLGRLAAASGFPVLVLAYDSEQNHSEVCAAVTAPAELDACRTAAIREKLYGTDETAVLAIDEPNSIVGRAVRVLRFVAERRPELGADRWLAGDTLRWDRIVIAGFSQGAALTGHLSMDQPFARAVLLAGGCDAFTDPRGQVYLASWCTAPRATPAERTFAIRHVMDESEEDMAIHAAFGLDAFGDYADAVRESPSYCTGTHLVETDLPSRGGGTSYHLSVAHDDHIPLDANEVPVLAEDYVYLFTGGR